MRTAHCSRQSIPPRSAFAGFRFPSDVIVLAVRWYLRFGLSYRDVEELLTERGVGGPRDGLPVGATVHTAAG
jgi:transposase-like protein